jgi:hypothetical protein
VSGFEVIGCESHDDERFKAQLHAIETQASDIAYLHGLLEAYQSIHISPEHRCLPQLTNGENGLVPVIRCVHGVDAMAIEPCSEKLNRLLLN